MQLREKVENEFSHYHDDMMHKSREDIFRHSDEIEAKKKIKFELLVFVSMIDRQQEEFLSVQENLIDSVYRFLDDSSWVPNDDEYQGFLRKWYASMIG